ncbi:MAG TPA: tetratricopeptide repeat protein, partial [Leptolyngbyaceae cyanobacterium]
MTGQPIQQSVNQPTPALLEEDTLQILIDYTLGGTLELASTQCLNAVAHQTDITSPWEYAHYIAMTQWLEAYEPLGETPLERVRGLLEAFHHTCQAEAWAVARAIGESRAFSGNQPLYQQLGQWGYFQEQVELCESLLNHVDWEFEQDLQLLVGDGLRQLGYFAEAREHYERVLATSLKRGDPKAELYARWGLVCLIMELSDHPQALVQLQQILPLAQQLLAWEKVAEVLQQLGSAYVYMGRIQQGLNILQEAISVATTHGLTSQKVSILQSLAKAYIWSGRSQKAPPYLNQCLQVYQEQGNLRMQAETLLSLAQTHFLVKDHEEALALARQSLEIHQEIHCLPGQVRNLNDLGVILAYGLHQFSEALVSFEEAFELAQKLDDWAASAITAAHQAYCHATLGQTPQADQA